MGQALYRKYRSKSLDEIVGQEHIVTALKQALAQGALSHAYLFTGPRGVGKTSVARILAHVVNDLPYTDESVHLDIIEIDAASNRRIDEIRELRERVHVAPTSAKYKVYIIDEVHMLTREAFNALLKTLEEPPAHVIFILATTEAHKLPETIISRTQRFGFKPIEPAKAVDALHQIAKAEKIKIDDPALMVIAAHGEGSFRDSLSLLDQVGSAGQVVTAEMVRQLVGEAPSTLLDGVLEALRAQDKLQLVAVLQTLDEQGYEAASVAKQLAARLRTELLGDQAALAAVDVLGLLGRLIEVPASPEPNIALELALLGAITAPVLPQPPALKPAPKPAAKAKAEPTAPIAEAEPAAAEARPARPTEIRQLDDGQLWPDVLAAIKQQHNTVYGVLRMARPSWEGNELTLSFGFAFHQKRLSDARNQALIAATIKQLTGQDVRVTCVVDSSLAAAPTSEATAETTDPDPTLESISNIFGSAELLES